MHILIYWDGWRGRTCVINRNYSYFGLPSLASLMPCVLFIPIASWSKPFSFLAIPYQNCQTFGFSYGFPMFFHGFPMFFHGFPMVFLCFSTMVSSMGKPPSPRRQVDVFTYNNALSACVKSHKWQQTLQLFQDASEFAEKIYIYVVYDIDMIFFRY